MPSIKEVIDIHIQALRAHDIPALVDGYSDDAVIIGGPQVSVGREAIHAGFANMPKGIMPPDLTFDLFTSHGDYIVVTYHTTNLQGSDTFVVRNGKIVMQSIHIVNR